MKDWVVDTLVRKTIEKRASSSGGEYLPLSVYANRGFDIDKIIQEVTDTKEMPGLGLCYRVPVEAVSEEKVEETIREQLCMRKEKRKPLKRRSSTSSDKKDEKDDKDDKDESSDEESTSSSSSDEKDKKQKKKKNKSKKDSRAGDRAKSEAKNQSTKTKKQKLEAAKMLSKTAPVLVKLQIILADEHVKSLPRWLHAELIKSKVTVERLDKEAKECMTATCPTYASSAFQEMAPEFVKMDHSIVLGRNMIEQSKKILGA